MDCRLCIDLPKTIQTDSRIHICLNPKCGGKYFYATPMALTKYYNNFLHVTLEDEEMRKTLSRIGKTKNTTEYILAWKKFVKDVVHSKSVRDIVRLGIYYRMGIGVKKCQKIGQSLLNLTLKIEDEPKNPCPVCLDNEEDNGNFIMCNVCGNMVCGYCYPRLANRLCPTCRAPLLGNIPTRINNLKELIPRGGRVSNYSKIFIAVLISQTRPAEAFSLFSNAVECGCNKGLLLLARTYLMGKGTVRDVKMGVSLLELGIKRGEPGCMIELGYIYSRGLYGISKNKKRSLEFYCKAIEHGDPQGAL